MNCGDGRHLTCAWNGHVLQVFQNVLLEAFITVMWLMKEAQGQDQRKYVDLGSGRAGRWLDIAFYIPFNGGKTAPLTSLFTIMGPQAFFELTLRR